MGRVTGPAAPTLRKTRSWHGRLTSTAEGTKTLEYTAEGLSVSITTHLPVLVAPADDDKNDDEDDAEDDDENDDEDDDLVAAWATLPPCPTPEYGDDVAHDLPKSLDDCRNQWHQLLSFDGESLHQTFDADTLVGSMYSFASVGINQLTKLEDQAAKNRRLLKDGHSTNKGKSTKQAVEKAEQEVGELYDRRARLEVSWLSIAPVLFYRRGAPPRGGNPSGKPTEKFNEKLEDELWGTAGGKPYSFLYRVHRSREPGNISKYCQWM